jgi:pimeloyl-ACP methyl ester carboxylesterase
MQVIAGYEDHAVTLRGLKFHYLEWGDADSPAMVLLHGLTGHAHIWDHMAPELARVYRLLAPDQRGHGDTLPHPATYATQDFVDDLEALRTEWGVERFVLMGLSMGGHNAMAYALAHPERVSRLIVIDIPPRLAPNRWPNRAEHEQRAREGHGVFADFEAAVEEVRADNATAPEENLRYRTKWNLRESDGGVALKWDPKLHITWDPADLTDALGYLSMPTLLVRGGRTDTLPRRVAEAMVTAMPDGELVQIETSGHSVPTDRPEELAPVVLEWLARRAGG